MNANFLLNIGPRPDGTIQEEFVTRLKEIGGWVSKNGESVFGTRGGPIGPRPWGVTTQKGKTVYVHVLDWVDPLLVIPGFGKSVKSAKMLVGGAAVPVKQVDGGWLLNLPGSGRDAMDTVVAMETA